MFIFAQKEETSTEVPVSGEGIIVIQEVRESRSQRVRESGSQRVSKVTLEIPYVGPKITDLVITKVPVSSYGIIVIHEVRDSESQRVREP